MQKLVFGQNQTFKTTMWPWSTVTSFFSITALYPYKFYQKQTQRERVCTKKPCGAHVNTYKYDPKTMSSNTLWCVLCVCVRGGGGGAKYFAWNLLHSLNLFNNNVCCLRLRFLLYSVIMVDNLETGTWYLLDAYSSIFYGRKKICFRRVLHCNAHIPAIWSQPSLHVQLMLMSF